MRVFYLVAALAAGLAIASASAQTGFEPRALKGPREGPPNELMVLGSPHLSQLPPEFQPAALAPLIDRLRAWKPQAIAVETLSGTLCDQLRRYPERHGNAVKNYCWDPAPARTATGLDVPAATAAAEQMLANWPAAPAPAQRRRLAALFLAGGERSSALVQWLRLPEAERRAEGALGPELVALLDKLRVSRSEVELLAAPLAAQLGLDRLHSMDDQSVGARVADKKAYAAAITRAWDNPANRRRRAREEALELNLATPQGVLAMYRAYNAPDLGKLVFESDFGPALEEPSPQRFGRRYVGYWETRNLRMAANIRDMLGATPGIRALVIVGASHKPYLDAYLDQMHDVRIVDTAAVLR